MQTILRYMLIVILPLLLVGCEQTDEPVSPVSELVKDFSRGPLTVTLTVSDDMISLAETLGVHIQAKIEPDYQLTLPEFDESFGPFDVRDISEPKQKLADDGRMITAMDLKLVPTEFGRLDLPVMTFHFIQRDDEAFQYTLETEPVTVSVVSLIGEDPNDFELADIDDVVSMQPGPWLWIVLGAAGACILITAVVVMIYIKRRERVPVRIYQPAHEIAMNRLHALEAEDLIEQGRLNLFYEKISTILRHYIEDRFDLRAPEQTTEEFLHTMSHDGQLSEPDKSSLGEFLTQCDLVKFAKHQPRPEQIKEAFNLAEGFVMKTKTLEKVIDVTNWQPEDYR